MSSPGSDSDSSESLFGDLLTNPYNAVDCLGLKEHPKLTSFESRMKNMFTFDRNKYREYSDLRLYSIQSCCRYQSLKHTLKFPNIPGYDSLFCVFGRSYTGYRAERFLQRRICTNNCNWDPSRCFLEDSHSGSLKDLMRTEFLDQYNPEFSHKFSHDKTNLRLKLDEEGHPKISELVEKLGISSKLVYDEEGSAANFDNLTDKFRNDERPLYILEEKKVNDIIVALLEAAEMNITSQKYRMNKIYQESYSGIGTQPITSLMMWGPQSSIQYSTSCSTECVIEEDSWNQLVLDEKMHECLNFSEKHYWMFGHGGGVHCENLFGNKLEGPAVTTKLTVVYPCSNSSCMVNCPCNLCKNTSKGLCSLLEHKKHAVRFHKDCSVQKQAQCQLHWVTHPEWFDSEEDVVVEKNVYFHNDELIEQPRSQAVEIIKFAGILKSCLECRLNLYDHFRNHLVFHLQCKFCSFQMATLEDKLFWKKVCKVCGKMFTSVVPKKINWHLKCHEESENFECNECDLKFKRKFTLKRHLLEDHGKSFHLDSIEEDILNHSEPASKRMDEKEDASSMVKTVERHECVACNKIFRLKRYLDRHVDLNHKEIEPFNCPYCDNKFKHKKNLKMHESTVHWKNASKVHRFMQETPVKYCCKSCMKEFNRSDTLRRHEKIHQASNPGYVCHLCPKKFTRKQFLTVHIKIIHNPERNAYGCITCGRKFNRKQSFVRHKKTNCHM